MLNGPIKQYIYLILPIAFLLGCNGFDNDERWQLVTHSSFFTVEDSLTGNKSIWEANEAGVNKDWQGNFGISLLSKVSFSIFNDKGLLTDPMSKQIHRIDLSNNEVLKIYSPALGTPYQSAEGYTYIASTDSLNGRIIFIRIKNGDESVLPTSYSPRKILFNAGKFYVQEGCCTIGIYHEAALAVINRIAFDDRIAYMALDANFNLRVLTDGPIDKFLFGIGSSSDIITQGASKALFGSIRFSEYVHSAYGTEYLENVTLKDNLLNIPEWTDSVSAFEMDFFESTVYYSWNDSLYRRGLKDDLPLWSAFLTGQIIEASHYRNYQGD